MNRKWFFGALCALCVVSLSFAGEPAPVPGAGEAVSPNPVIPNFQLMSPNGGEKLVVESAFKVTWSCIGAKAYSLYLSADGGKTWNALAKEVPGNECTYEWKVSAPGATAGSTNCYMRAEALLANGRILQDASDKPFSIVTISNAGDVSGTGTPAAVEGMPAPKPVPTLTVTSPNGGEIFAVGTMTKIMWTPAVMASMYHVYFSYDGGKSWSLIAKEIKPDVTMYEWKVTAPTTSDNCLVKVEAASQLGMVIEDVSDKPFIVKTTAGAVSVTK